jgi:prepilin-type N-terminal cleavage/methylation domain-containing protein
LQLPPPDAILGSVSKAFEECCPIKRFQNKHNVKHIQNKVLTHNSKAFTLSEVLIALVVIGIVAAITVPTLMANYKKQEASARIKKFYSTMQQVVTKAKADGNDWEDWADTASNIQDNSGVTIENFAPKYLLPYISYNKILTNLNSIYIYLNDGTYFYIAKGGCIDIVFDINGDKKPNVEGRDIFRLLYCPKSNTARETSKIIPYKLKSITTREQAMQYCKDDTHYCTALLSFDGWEFKSDYPYHL